MIPPLDVFSIKNNESTWLWPAESEAQALEMVCKRGAGVYFIFSHQTGHKTMYQVEDTGTVQVMYCVDRDSELSALFPPHLPQ